MGKKDLKYKIQGFIQGKLSEKEELKLLDWVKKNESNKSLFLETQHAISTQMLKQGNKELDKKWNSLNQRISSQQMATKPGYRRIWTYKVAASVAAAFIIGFIIPAIVFYFGKYSFDQTVSSQQITTPYGAQTSMTLPDGSVVNLNAGSKLLYPSGFGKQRMVELAGEAFFEVKKSKQPFIVQTKFGDVTVKGTSFNINAFEGESFATTLVTGKVLVEAKDGNSLLLNPGFQAIETGEGLKAIKVDTEIYTSWKEGKLIFRKEYLPIVAKRLERWYNIKIQLDNDPRLGKIHYSGTLEMETFSEVLELLQVTAPVKYAYNKQNRLVKIYYDQ